MVYPIHLLKFESPFLRILSIYSIMICWSWNSFQSQCYLLYFCFDFIVPSNSHLMIPIKMQWRQTLQSFWTGHWNKKPKSEHQICTCRLDWESHKISRTDFPLRQDCLSICNTMPSRFQTRSLGHCHQNFWSTEHRLWIKKVRLYVQFKIQWVIVNSLQGYKRKKKKRHFIQIVPSNLGPSLEIFFYACQFETPPLPAYLFYKYHWNGFALDVDCS